MKLRRDPEALVADTSKLFTVHVPHDLVKGCAQRIISFALSLGDHGFAGARLFRLCGALAAHTGTSRVARLAAPGDRKTTHLPHRDASHVADGRRGTALNRHVVVSINNNEEASRTTGRAGDKDATKKSWSRTCIADDDALCLTTLASKPADAKALWNEVCKSWRKKSWSLPYKDSQGTLLTCVTSSTMRWSPAFRGSIRIRRKCSWAHYNRTRNRKGRRRLCTARPGRAPRSRRHAENFRRRSRRLTARLDTAKGAADRGDRRRPGQQSKRISKEVSIVGTEPQRAVFVRSVTISSRTGKGQLRSRDLSAINPADFLPEDDFVAAVE